MNSETEIKFAPNQKLPYGYRVIWDEGTEHYHWICGEKESCIFSSRWQARWDAISHSEFKEFKKWAKTPI